MSEMVETYSLARGSITQVTISNPFYFKVTRTICRSAYIERRYINCLKCRPTDTFIAVVGAAGSGKSTLISLLAEQPIDVGHTLDTCMSNLSKCLKTGYLSNHFKRQWQGRRILLRIQPGLYHLPHRHPRLRRYEF